MVACPTNALQWGLGSVLQWGLDSAVSSCLTMPLPWSLGSVLQTGVGGGGGHTCNVDCTMLTEWGTRTHARRHHQYFIRDEWFVFPPYTWHKQYGSMPVDAYDHTPPYKGPVGTH